MHQLPAKYLVLIDNGGASTALLFTAERRQVAEFDGASEEVAVMTRKLIATPGVAGPEWDAALSGSSAAERAAAELYTLDV